MNITVSLRVRNGLDPYLVAEVLTENTFNFGISSRDMFILGVAFCVIGAFTIVQPVVYIWKIRNDMKEVDYKRERVAKRKEEYHSYLDEMPDSVTEPD